MSENSLAKIAISSSADEALSKSLEKVNLNFDGGRVTKVDLASWLIHYFTESLSDGLIQEIRRAHFNQVAYLEALVRKLKSAGRDSLNADEQSTLQELLGQQSTKRRVRAKSSEEAQDKLNSIS